MGSQENKTFTIVTAANEGYANFLFVLLSSLKTNFQKPFELYIINDGLSKETFARLEHISNESTGLNFIYLPDFKNQYSFGNKLDDAHFWRLIAPYILCEKEKILYLDADTMVRKDITDLFSLFDPENTVSACVDYVETIKNGIMNWEDFQFNPHHKYFNSGVLLIDTKRFIEKDVAIQILEKTKRYSQWTKAYNKWEQYDQYGFNVVLYDDWFEIPNIYNYGSELKFKDASIVHFNGHGKPSSNSCTLQYKNEFYKFLDKAIN